MAAIFTKEQPTPISQFSEAVKSRSSLFIDTKGSNDEGEPKGTSNLLIHPIYLNDTSTKSLTALSLPEKNLKPNGQPKPEIFSNSTSVYHKATLGRVSVHIMVGNMFFTSVIPLHLKKEGTPITILIQNPLCLAQVVIEGLNQAY